MYKKILSHYQTSLVSCILLDIWWAWGLLIFYDNSTHDTSHAFAIFLLYYIALHGSSIPAKLLHLLFLKIPSILACA